MSLARSWIVAGSLAWLAGVSQAHAAGMETRGLYLHFETSFIPVYTKTNDPGRTGSGLDVPPPVATSTTLGIDTRNSLGVVLWEKIFLGGTFNYRTDSTKRDAVEGGNDSANDSFSSWDSGPTFGVVLGNFRLMFTALALGHRKTHARGSDAAGTSTIDISRDDKLGLGWQLLAGYAFPLTGSLRIGPTLVYRQVNYRSSTLTDGLNAANNSTDVGYFTRPTDGSLQPMVTVALDF
jgi:hypothetical protein